MTGFQGWYDTGVVEFLGRALEAQSSDLPVMAKSALLAAEYLEKHYHGSLYGKAQNVTLELRKKYDEILADADALVMPAKPAEYGDFGDIERLKEDGAGSNRRLNTALFDVTHHPALTVPCAETDGAPVGILFVGERFDDATLLHLGHVYEQAEK